MVPPFNFRLTSLWIVIVVILQALTPTTITLVHSKTDGPDVSALNVMYSSLSSPSQLDGWKSSGGDPCGESWEGIKCSGSSVTEIDLSGLKLSGSMGYQLSSLTSVTYFDLSNNNLKNDIPYQLPPNAAHIDLSKNSFTGGVPYSLSQMKDLEYLNIGHNQLKGQLSEMFVQLSKLKELDLSFNKLYGNLPQSFRNLTSLTKLHLQNNQFSGSINPLADLSLNDLNVANNEFTGWIPDELKDINNIETGGNSWSSGPAPPPPPGQKSNPHAHKPLSKGDEKSGLSGAAIAGIVFGVLLALVLVIALFTRRRSSTPPSHFIDEDRVSQRRAFTPLASQELSNDSRSEILKDFRGLKSSDSSSSLGLQSSLSMGLMPTPLDHTKSFDDGEFVNHMSIKRSSSIRMTCYSWADLQTATGNFATGRLLGEGTIGQVYRAKYADGKVFAVKKIDSSLLQDRQGGDFGQIASNISKLRHPNIAELVGYCSEQGQNMLVHEYYRNGSLHEFLHLSDDFSKPLTWNTRVRIALGTARAVELSLSRTISCNCINLVNLAVLAFHSAMQQLGSSFQLIRS
ncbi:protein STRUBBELIG-RECEPTOR FAMILY 5 isoform X4 [Rhododendron vialii]|uniref:protein STRUBBELIG-RECEPTOR FAMILY 5 isoform X4 n=1 Tax=Rhododendron vialii TaxID=182163 RepID=UPI00265E7E72|nr:protein STRUBBELIG-RECEPTOR FAMILY 5 isoform X4 [Rhododendron vialii]